jgi:hypothetical protein
VGERRLGPLPDVEVAGHHLEGDVLAWTYVLNGYEGGLPSARYLGLIAEAADAVGCISRQGTIAVTSWADAQVPAGEPWL